MSSALFQNAVIDPGYGAVPKPAWALRLAGNPRDITKVRTILQLADACDLKVTLGNDVIGHFVIGAKDGVWDNLCEANIIIHAAVDTFASYLAGELAEPQMENLDPKRWAFTLKSIFKAACESALADCAAGKLLELHEAIDGVEFAYEKIKQHGEASSSDSSVSNFVNAYLYFMTITGALWMDVCYLVVSKTGLCHDAAVPVVPEARQASKLRAGRYIVRGLPQELREGAQGVLKELLEDTLDIYDLALDLFTDAEAADVDLEESRAYAAFVHLHDAANKLAGTSLAEVKVEGVETALTDERWTIAAKEGLVIYMRGQPLHFALPQDLLERLLDYVIHVLPILALLVSGPDKEKDGNPWVGRRRIAQAGNGNLSAKTEELSTLGSAHSVSDQRKRRMNLPKHLAVMPWLKQRWAALEADTEAKLAAAAARAKEDEARHLLRVPISLPANGYPVASMSYAEAAEKSAAGYRSCTMDSLSPGAPVIQELKYTGPAATPGAMYTEFWARTCRSRCTVSSDP